MPTFDLEKAVVKKEPDDNRLQLPTVTVFAMADNNYLPATMHALKLSQSRVRFCDAALFAEIGGPAPTDNVFSWLPKEAFSREGGSVTLLHDLPKLAPLMLASTHLLIVQHDGFVCNPDAWTDEFLEYDYIGAPWPDNVVGNCGFCLMSRKFLEAVASLNLPPTPAACHPADVVLCRRHRADLEAKGIRFAPVELARRFAVEGGTYEGQFGFHGWALVPQMVAQGFYTNEGRWDGPAYEVKPVEASTPQRTLESAAALHKAKRVPEAIKLLEEMIAAEREQHEAARLLAMIYSEQGENEKALPLLEYSAAMRPHEPGRRLFLANVLNAMGYRERAGEVYRQAIAQAPDTPQYHWCYALWLLGQQRIREGFEEYRWSYFCRSRMMRHPKPEWNGQPIPGKTLYVCGEQGYGDEIMMSRFFPLLKERSQAHIVLEVHEPLVPLFLPGQNLLPTGDEVVVMDPSWEFRSRFDEWINPFTIPYVLGVEIEDVKRLDIGSGISAYRVPWVADRVKRYRESGMTPTRRVGLAWKGSAANAIDKTRSITVDHFMPLLDIPGIQFVSLQYGERVSEHLGVEQPDLSSLDKTAAVMQGLDAVVSVDTMIANLACTMGIPTHVLATTSSDYRWGLEGSTSPWYAAARVYRQQKPGDYEDQMQAVRRALMGESPG